MTPNRHKRTPRRTAWRGAETLRFRGGSKGTRPHGLRHTSSRLAPSLHQPVTRRHFSSPKALFTDFPTRRPNGRLPHLGYCPSAPKGCDCSRLVAWLRKVTRFSTAVPPQAVPPASRLMPGGVGFALSKFEDSSTFSDSLLTHAAFDQRNGLR